MRKAQTAWIPYWIDADGDYEQGDPKWYCDNRCSMNEALQEARKVNFPGDIYCGAYEVPADVVRAVRG